MVSWGGRQGGVMGERNREPAMLLIVCFSSWVFILISLHLLSICCYCCLVPKSCPTLLGHMDCSPPGSSVRGISQARILEWVAISFSRASSQSWDQVQEDSLPLSHWGSPCLCIVDINYFVHVKYLFILQSELNMLPANLLSLGSPILKNNSTFHKKTGAGGSEIKTPHSHRRKCGLDPWSGN